MSQYYIDSHLWEKNGTNPAKQKIRQEGLKPVDVNSEEFKLRWNVSLNQQQERNTK